MQMNLNINIKMNQNKRLTHKVSGTDLIQHRSHIAQNSLSVFTENKMDLRFVDELPEVTERFAPSHMDTLKVQHTWFSGDSCEFTLLRCCTRFQLNWYNLGNHFFIVSHLGCLCVCRLTCLTTCPTRCPSRPSTSRWT